MEYRPEQLDVIKKYGEQLTPPEEVAALLGIDEMEFIEDVSSRNSEVRRAYVTGLASTANKLRQQNLEAAMAGSPAAIAESLQQLSRINL